MSLISHFNWIKILNHQQLFSISISGLIEYYCQQRKPHPPTLGYFIVGDIALSLIFRLRTVF